MKVKSFDVGMVRGMIFAIGKLDKQVRNLGDIKIYSVIDTFYPKEVTEESCGAILVRVVVYEK